MFEKLLKDQLVWFPEIGIGYYPVSDFPYGKDYFEKYEKMGSTEMGKAITKARVDLVNKYTHGEVIDIGIGSGEFVSSRENTFGYDVNPFGVDWLLKNDKLKNPSGAESMSFWDSLEHIQDPSGILFEIKEYAFISIPLFKDANHVLTSRHFRKDEHFWYFTLFGLQLFMNKFGLHLVEWNMMETELGREDIGTFVFRKIKN